MRRQRMVQEQDAQRERKLKESAQLDAATRDRVMQEFEQDKARMEQVRWGGGGGGDRSLCSCLLVFWGVVGGGWVMTCGGLLFA